MFDTAREWGLAFMAVLGFVFTPVAYVLSLKGDIRVMKAEMEALKAYVEREVSAIKDENGEIKDWLIRVEGKLDRVLYGGKD